MSDTSASDASAQPEQPIVEITNCWPTGPDGADDGVHEHLIASEPTEPRKIPLRFVQGFFMGSADIVPGVSGGTVALVFGIYHAFVGNIRIAAKSVIALLKGDFSGAVSGLGLTKASFRTAGTFDWYFIVSLLAGILTAFVLLRHQIESLLESNPETLAAIFVGLVGASVVIAWPLMGRLDPQRIATMVAVTVATFAFLGLQAGAVADPSPLLFFGAGAVAVCAMILPGISGSFVLLMLGMYAAVLGGEPIDLLFVLLGCIVGITSFSSVLGWLLRNHERTLVAGLIGLMLGSARVLWPWPNGVGIISDVDEEVVSGTAIHAPPNLGHGLGALAMAVAAFVAVLVLAKLAERADERLSN